MKHFGTLGGIVIPASHNPKEYNGYKVYDDNGCQLVPSQAKNLLEYINGITDFTSVSFDGDDALVQKVDVTDVFVDAALSQSRLKNKERTLKIVYTPLHGTGRIPLMSALCKDGFSDILTVDEQMTEDGNFPTVKPPNPEDRRALLLGIEKAKEHGADIVLGTDPDCDRVGVAVRTDGGYVLMTGNQIGALLMDFIVTTTELSSLSKPAIIKTTVTSELGAEIAAKHGIAVFTTLTEFKYIGEKIGRFEQAKRIGDKNRDFDFVFGYEESYGYLAGTHARDKDAVVSGILYARWRSSSKKRGRLSATGWQSCMMNTLRASQPPFDGTIRVIDYLGGASAEEGFGLLPSSDVMKYILTDGSWIAVRPSGTEPKIKIYYGASDTVECLATADVNDLIKLCLE